LIAEQRERRRFARRNQQRATGVLFVAMIVSGVTVIPVTEFVNSQKSFSWQRQNKLSASCLRVVHRLWQTAGICSPAPVFSPASGLDCHRQNQAGVGYKSYG
jgi:hypothetical protein